jgi:FkbM family methyltransferase
MSTIQSVIAVLDGMLNGTAPQVIDRLPLNGIEKHFYTFYFLNRHLLSDELHKSQISQDLWVALLLNCWNEHSPSNTNGFFVEFGGFDGVQFSNSYLFEKKFHWKGIIAEPNQYYFNKCRDNRSCIIDNRCVWSESHKILNFNVVPNAPELATIEVFENSDCHATERLSSKKVVSVDTVSLIDLLVEHNAPTVIEYLSIDTEGTELEILKHFDFSRYHFKIVSVEHNFSDSRKDIYDLMTHSGYFRLPRSVDYFDDMYISTGRSPQMAKINHWLLK